jgi:curved DNA-binding protein CbpA
LNLIYIDHMTDQKQIPLVNYSENYAKPKQIDLFEILGVQPDATLDLIKVKYAEKLLLYHPDKGGDPVKFNDLTIAFKILSNPKNRLIYTESLASTFNHLTKDYRDPLTGKYLNLGYELSTDDFMKGSTPDEIEQKREIFLQKFENMRTETEKNQVNKLHQSMQKEQTFEEMINQRRQQSQEIEIPVIEGLDPKNLDVNLFNQIFEKNSKKQSQTKTIQKLEEINGICQNSLYQIENQSNYIGLFGNNPDYTQLNWNTHENPKSFDPDEYDQTTDITKIRDNNEDDLKKKLKHKILEHQIDRLRLLNIDDEDYHILKEHDPLNNPLSYVNVLSSDPK